MLQKIRDSYDALSKEGTGALFGVTLVVSLLLMVGGTYFRSMDMFLVGAALFTINFSLLILTSNKGANNGNS